MYTVLLPPGDNPIAVNKYIMSSTSLHVPYTTFVLFSQVHPTSKILYTFHIISKFEIYTLLCEWNKDRCELYILTAWLMDFVTLF
jgi:hypothetical protein